MSLRDLDDRWLPRAAARARAWVDALQRVRQRTDAGVRSFDLDHLDERWARGPLRTLQRRPALGLVLTVVLLTAGVVASVGHEHDRVAVPPQPQLAETASPYDVGQGTQMGPGFGADVATYVSTATSGLVQAVHTDPRASRVALVSFSSYLTPEAAQLLLRGYQVARVYVRAPAAGPDATPFTVEVHGDVLAALRVAYAETARLRTQAATSYQSYVDTLKGSSKEDQAFRELYEGFARASAVEAQQYAGNCACTYSALVEATPPQLVLLRARPGVRVVEVAPVGTSVAQVQVQPLLPEVTGTVPRPTVEKHG